MFVLTGVVLTVVFLVLLLWQYYPPLWLDLCTIWITVKVIYKTKVCLKKRELIVDRLEKQARETPAAPFVIFKESRFSYSTADREATRVARALMAHGVRCGDNVAVVMSNEPGMIWAFFGIQKLGGRAALVNHHLKADALIHSVTSCDPKLVIVGTGDDLPTRVASLLSQLEPQHPVVVFGDVTSDQSAGLPALCDVIAGSRGDTEPIDPSVRSQVKVTDPMGYIYTPGTTGFPKPAIMNHKKVITASQVYGSLRLSQHDVLYLPLPLYHASALSLALFNVINVGASVVLREKFSASQFWPDCVKYDVTCFQYIGEMLRYLVNIPKCEEERQHRVLWCVGNGLRPDIWPVFQSRFQVPQIYEFYGSTEGPATVTNLFNITGSVGRLSPLLSRATHQILVRVDPATSLPTRNSSGRCERVSTGESGLLLAKLTKYQTFEGYLGPEHHTSSRLIHDVLHPGDCWVNTNDVFTLDKDYNLTFKDRLGDSFRWKGENVSTAEVSSVVNSVDFVQDTNVFGIEVPGCEGKAGMAAVTLKDSETLTEERLCDIGQMCCSRLPTYARPRFLRIQRQMSLTSTFKHQKTELVKEGFDPSTVDEPLYYLDTASGVFKPLDKAIYQDIVKGKVML